MNAMIWKPTCPPDPDPDPLQAEQYPGVSDAYIRRYKDSKPDVRCRALALTVEVMQAVPSLKDKVGRRGSELKVPMC